MRREILPGLRRLAAVGGVALLATLAAGYDLIRSPTGTLLTWNDGPIPLVLRLPAGTTFSDGTTHTTTVQAALAEWNAQLARVQFAADVQATGFAGDFNGLNEVTFEPRIYHNEPDGIDFGANVLAVTLSYRSGLPREDGTYARVESDVIFNSTRSWDSYRGALQSAVDIRRVAIHEFGHVLGLDHPNQDNQTVLAIMNSTISYLDGLQPDDIHGAQFQYGRPGGFAAPANDHFANAAPLALNGTGAVVNTESIGATRESGEPLHGAGDPQTDPGATGGASIWWRWTATAGGRLKVDTKGSPFDTMLAAYTGDSLATLTQLAGEDDIDPGIIRTSEIEFDVVFGTTYHFAVDGWAGEWGVVKLSFNLVNPIEPPFVVTPPVDRAISVGEAATFSVGVTGAAPLAYRWQVSAGGTGEWTDLNDDALHTGTATAELTLPAAATNVRDGNAYRCRITNAGGQAFTAAVTVTIERLAQSIDFPAPADRGYTPVPFALAATAGSGLPVSFDLVSGPATLDGAGLTLTGPGAVTVRATQAGDATYAAAAPVERTFTVTKGAAAVILGGLAQTYAATPRSVTVGTTPPGLAFTLTYDGTATPPTAAGSYAVEATVVDALYEGAAGGTLVIARAAQTIDFAAPADRAFTTEPVALSAASSAGLPVSFSVVSGPARIEDAAVVLTGAGAVTVRAAQAGGPNHLAAAEVDRTFQVAETFVSWTLAHFSADERLDPAISGPSADPDGDGFANLLEYALGLDPRAASAAGIPEMSATETEWVFTYTRPAARGDVTYAVEFSTNLATWTDAGVVHERLAAGLVETWCGRVPRSTGETVFFRVRATR